MCRNPSADFRYFFQFLFAFRIGFLSSHLFGQFGMAFGKKGYKGILPYLTFAGVSTCLTMFLLSNFVGAEVTSMGTGLISILLSVAYVKLVGVKTPDEFRNESANHQRKYS